MKKLLSTVLFGVLLLLQQGVFSPVSAGEYVLDDPFAIIKQEISEKTKILTFETRRISAKYPSETINPLGMNFPGYRGSGQLVVIIRGLIIQPEQTNSALKPLLKTGLLSD